MLRKGGGDGGGKSETADYEAHSEYSDSEVRRIRAFLNRRKRKQSCDGLSAHLRAEDVG